MHTKYSFGVIATKKIESGKGCMENDMKYAFIQLYSFIRGIFS